MRRRTVSRQNTDVELFPFLSILACTIGTLILLIMVLSTQTLTKQEVKIVAREDANGVNKSKTPRYIECRKDGIVIHPSQQFVPVAQLNNRDSALQELITLIRINRDTEYLIIAVRPNGIDVFNQVRSIVQKAEIDIGYEPLDAGWQLITEEDND